MPTTLSFQIRLNISPFDKKAYRVCFAWTEHCQKDSLLQCQSSIGLNTARNSVLKAGASIVNCLPSKLAVSLCAWTLFGNKCKIFLAYMLLLLLLLLVVVVVVVVTKANKLTENKQTRQKNKGNRNPVKTGTAFQSDVLTIKPMELWHWSRLSF